MHMRGLIIQMLYAQWFGSSAQYNSCIYEQLLCYAL